MITDAFVVVVIGGMGSIVGSYIAAVLVAEVKALCIGIGLVHFAGFSVNFSKLTLVAEFLVMAVVLIARPQGLLGRPQQPPRTTGAVEAPIRPASLPLGDFRRRGRRFRSSCCRSADARRLMRWCSASTW